MNWSFAIVAAALLPGASPLPISVAGPPNPVLSGADALGDWSTDRPGIRRRITVKDLPEPYATSSVDNGPRLVARPEGRIPTAPPGFAVNVYAAGLRNPRVVRALPNGDILVSESAAGRVRILRDTNADGIADTQETFLDGLKLPFGIATYPVGDKPTHLYIAETDQVIRVPYRLGDFKPNGQVNFVKQYIGQHAVHYEGTYDGNRIISGQWKIPAYNMCDAFEISKGYDPNWDL